MSEDTTCTATNCGRPSDDWIVCGNCADELLDVLADMPWMLDELDTVITQQTRYTTQSSGRSAETPLVFNIKAADTKARLISELAAVARTVAGANGWTLNYRTPVECSAWLERSISAIRLHPAGGEMVDTLASWHAACLWVIDRPAQRQYLGDCSATHELIPCPGAVYGRASKPEAKCDTCGATYQADARREQLLKELDDKVCTAAEIAHLSTYLGLDISREQVRKRINQWHKRGQIARKGGDLDPTFRFGDALALLAKHDTTKRTA